MTFVQRHPISFFFVALIVVTYMLGIAAVLALRAIQQALGIDIAGVNDIVLKFGPTLAGVLTIALLAGKQGLKDLFRRCIRWRFSTPLYLGAILVPPAITLAVLFLRGFGPEVQSLSLVTGIEAFALQLLLAVFLGGGFGEELGWRGFLLPRLSGRYSHLVASLVVAIAWFVWHIPAFVFFDKGASDPVLPFAVILFPFSIILTWTYFRSKECLLVPILVHGSINASSYAMENLLPQVTGAAGFQPAFDWTVAGIWCAIAGIVVVKWGFSLSKEPSTDER